MAECTDCKTERICGTGIARPPLPGDPNNIASIRAFGTFGGIEVRITYPSVNAFAVSFCRLFRGKTPDFSQATEHAIVNGSLFYDRIDGSPQTFYYWVKFVSVQGTEQEPIGPAQATSQDRTLDYLNSLHESIHEGFLAKRLREQIDQIELNKLGITQEILLRAQNDDALAASINEMRAFTDTALAVIQEERLARIDDRGVFVGAVDTLYAQLGDANAAIQNERTARLNQFDALAKNVTKVETQLVGNIAQVEQTMQTNIQSINGTLQSIGALYTVKVNVNGLVGGFGIYNNGKEIEAGFDVNRFWIGSGSSKYKPFIISGNNVFFNGRVEFSNVNNGPPANADRTADNVARDTQRLAGHDAHAFANSVLAARDKANTWTRPNTTLIDGNKIFTGDAYVDTLQIKGYAVTSNERVSTATGVVSGGGWLTLAVKQVIHPGNGGSGVIIIVNVVAASTGTNSDPTIYVHRNGHYVDAKHSVVGYATSVMLSFFDPWPGVNPTYTIRLEATDGGGQRDGTRVFNGEVIFLSSKR